MPHVDNYFLPKEYKENPVNITMDKDDSFYWDESRVNRSRLHQFAVYQWAEKIVKTHNIKVIADVGCGFAAKLSWLYNKHPHLNVIGIDQPHAVDLCKEKHNFGDWLGVNFEDKPEQIKQKVDLIISSDVIEHLEDPRFLLNYFKAISTKDTLILISTPERDLLRGSDTLNSPNPYHIREWNKSELSTFLKSEGFDIIEHRILPALRRNLQSFYLQKVVRRLLKGRSMKYNQAILMKIR